MIAELQRVNQEIAALKQEFYSLLDKENTSKSEQYKVGNFEKELARLEDYRKTLVTALSNAPAPTNSILCLATTSCSWGNFHKPREQREFVPLFTDLHLGYHDGENDAFWYEGDDLMIRVLFESKENADYFHRRLNDESLYHSSELAITDISLTCTTNLVGKQIFATDYNLDEVNSPQDAVSFVSGATSMSIVDSSTPLFKFQRIESDSVFGLHYKADNCHLIDNAYYASNPHEEDDVENNRLALSSDVHHWFDGRSVDVPLFKLPISTVHLISSKPVIENRYEVPLLVRAFDEDAARLLFPRLREGSTFYKDRK